MQTIPINTRYVKVNFKNFLQKFQNQGLNFLIFVTFHYKYLCEANNINEDYLLDL